MKKHLLLLLFILGFGVYAFADHVVGSDILYRCLGNGKYEITFKFYRDCNGCNVQGGGGGGTGASCPHPVLSITGANGSCNGQGLGNVNITRISITDITQLCGTTKSACAGGTFPYGIEEHLYKGTIDLSASIAAGCCKFKISTTIFVRSTTISTGAANQGFYTDATINACDSICNSSPVYTSHPVAIICVGQDFVFNNGALDTIDQGDSLSYELAPAFQGANSQVSYTGSFSAQRPLSFLGFPNANLVSPAGFHLDPVTGDLSFRPTKVNETGVLVIEVVEWRRINGVMKEVGRTRRDMQVIVVSCPNNKIPTIAPPFSANACVGQQICMDIVTDDPDKTRDSVVISWNRGIPRATFTHNNGQVRFASGQVCWTPTETDVSSIPHTFTITAKDNACPLSGVAIRAFSITVRETPKATRKFTPLTCGNVINEAIPFKSYPGGLEVERVVKDSIGRTYYFGGNKLIDTIQFKPGFNVVTLVLKTKTPCVNAFADTIIIDPYVQVELPNDTFLCEGSTIDIVSATKYGKAPYRYQWNTAANDTLTNLNGFAPTTDTSVYVTVSDGEGCKHADTMHFLYRLQPLIHLDTGKRICYNEIVELDAGNDTFPSYYTYLWNTVHNNLQDTSRKITVGDSGIYIATVKDSIGCTNTDTFRLYVNTAPVSLGPDIKVCNGDTAKLTATGTDTYKWYKLPDPAVVGIGNKYNEVLTVPTNYRVTGTRTYDGVTCENDDTIAIDINPLPTINFVAIPDKCSGSVAFNLNQGIAFPTIMSGTWTCLDNANWVTNNNFYPDSVVVTHPSGFQTITVKYDVVDGNGCKKSDVTTFRVIRLPEVNLKDSSICADRGKVDLRQLTLSPTNIAPGTWKWSSTNTSANAALEGTGSNTVFNLASVPQGQTYPLCLEVTNLFGCPNSNCLDITVRTVPVVEAGFISPKCENDTIFSLLTSQGLSPAGGTWQSLSGGIINTDWFNPALVTPDNFYPLIYTYDIPGNNCPVSDTLRLQVKSRPNIVLTPPADICSSVGTFNLMNNVNPAGGIWSAAKGITTAGSFDAANNIGTTNFRYDYTGSNGCKHYVTGSVKVDPAPTVQITPPTAACVGVPVDITAAFTNAAGINWTTSGSGSFNAPASTQTQYIPGAGDNNCLDISVATNGSGACAPATQTINICFYPIPNVDFTVDPAAGCEPLLVNFDGITDLPNNATYEWDFGDPASGNNTATLVSAQHVYNENGTYSVALKVTSERNCSNISAAKQIVVHPKPVAAIDADYWLTTVEQTRIRFVDRTTIDAPGNITSYLWEFGDPDNNFSPNKNPSFEYPTDTGTYIVKLKVVSADGCEDETERPLVILPKILVFIPNAFIPDKAGEQANERFWVTASDFATFQIDVFSRWGELLYTSKEITEGWDGKFKGQAVPQGVYFYVVNMTDLKGEKLSFKGTITLLR